MAKKQPIPTVEQVRQELFDGINSLEGVRIGYDAVGSDPRYGPMQDISGGLREFVSKMLDRASAQLDEINEAKRKEFEASIDDKKRQLELGELADKFFQRIKLNG